MYCQKCGTKLEGNLKYCQNCGNKINKFNNKYLIIGLPILLLVITLGIVLYFILQPKNQFVGTWYYQEDDEFISLTFDEDLTCKLEYYDEEENCTYEYDKENIVINLNDEETTLEYEIEENYIEIDDMKWYKEKSEAEEANKMTEKRKQLIYCADAICPVSCEKGKTCNCKYMDEDGIYQDIECEI